MRQDDRMLINEYKNYLIKLKLNTTEINMNIKSVDDINEYKEESKSNLKKLEILSKEYKLYDKNYEDFRIAMGKFAMGLSKSHKLNLNNQDKVRLNLAFLDLNDKFEELMRKNIVKDAYVWK
ncbi:hypothetical protein [Romboutsia sp. 13368]|uniref:hypothetical protein n=1 Tax=Romboutsia sp. 13368 TaxID=2708053 RepID=UPI0025F7BAB4|nr:hypothetical protein [Romboutsia sp. 13368]